MQLAPCSGRVSPARAVSMKHFAVSDDPQGALLSLPYRARFAGREMAELFRNVVADEAALHAALRSHFQEGTA